ncbi:MAG: hypothetical protein ACI31S_05255 [Bacilli bacterium]
MEEKIKKIVNSRVFVIVMVILLITLVITAGTYAWFTWSSTNNTSLTMTIGDIAEVTFDNGPDINVTDLAPVYNYNDGEQTNFIITTEDEAGTTLYQTILLNIESIPTALRTESFRYVMYKDDISSSSGEVLITSGSFEGRQDGDSIILYSGALPSGSTRYTFYIYIDGNYENDPSMMNQSFIGNIEVKVSRKQLLSTTISNLYANTEKTVVTNNNIEYNYATSVGLMNDRLGGVTASLDGGNIRYYGASPNNYIYFNCSDYSNQSDSTCELWRIIGVFGDKVKIIRNDSIGQYSWDNKDQTTGAESNYGKNDWTTARLMKLLNPSDYYTIDLNDNGLGQSLYYNSQSGTCFAGRNNATVSCDFTSTGIKNDTTRNMIAEVTWNLGGYSTSKIYSNDIYIYERGTNVFESSSINWNGKIALMYPSDYGYATNFNLCSQVLWEYNNDMCKENDWLFTSFAQYALSPYSEKSYGVFANNYEGKVGTSPESNPVDIRPTLYLNSDIEILSGEGTGNSPYKLVG